MKIHKKIISILLLFAVIFIVPEVITRVFVGRGNRFYILRDVTFKLTEVKKVTVPIDILCLGGSASAGMGLKNIQDRYSEIIARDNPELIIVNDSNTGAPLSEINYYLYSCLKINNVRKCIIFSGNNEYLELLNRNEHPSRILFLARYLLPKAFSIISYISNTTHNILNSSYQFLTKHTAPARFAFAIEKGGGKDSWPYINKTMIGIQNIFYRMRLLELKGIIKAHPETDFIFVIAPINYSHDWEHMKKYDMVDMEKPDDINTIRQELEKHWIRRRFLITPKLQKTIQGYLGNIKNLYILDLDSILLKSAKNNPWDTEQYFLDYCHLNPQGHKILAEQLKQKISN